MYFKIVFLKILLMNVAWSQRYSSYKRCGSRNLRPSNVYTVEFRQPIHKNFEDILDNNKQYIKLYKLSQDYY